MHDEYQPGPEAPELDRTDPSKSERKRAAQAVLDMAKQLVEMGDKLFNSLSLDEEVRQAAALAKSIRAHGGRKRQIQYLAKLLRQSDIDALQQQLDQIDARAQNSARAFHQVERWRDRLIEEGDAAIAALIDGKPDVDRQQLRQLIRNARLERERNKPPKAARALFQYLKTLW